MTILSRLAVSSLFATVASLALAAPAENAPAPGTPADAPAPTPAPAPAAGTAPLTANEARAANGLVVSANLREEYLTGFPMLVTVTVRNDGAEPLTFPDLSARPHLVRFTMKKGAHEWERYSTPPATEPTATWTIAPRAQRQVLLAVPSSAGIDAGEWQLGVSVHDPAGTVSIAKRAVRLAPAEVAAGAYHYEPTIQKTTGAMIPWLHEGAGGFDLYLMQLAKGSAKTVGQFHLARLSSKVEPILSRSRPADAASRYVYWASGPQAITLARLEGTALRGKPRTVSVPYPKAELLSRGVTDAKGGVIVPLWVPDPSGTGGTVRALCVDDRGGQVLREVARLPARPATVTTAVDAASNLLIALGHGKAVDLYRVDPRLAPEIGARGARVTALADGWTSAALVFDTLPDQPSRAGGLALLTLLTRPGDPAGTYKTLWSDLAGKPIQESQPLPWTAPGAVTGLVPSGYGPFYYLTTEPGGALWYGVQAAAPQKVEGARGGTLFLSGDTVQLRRIVDGTVIADRVLGPVAQ